MTNRPEYIRCIQHTHADRKKTSWCGKSIYSFDWVFQDIDHAIYATMSEARQVPCPECIAAICEVFKDA
jgi:hypothetical protein